MTPARLILLALLVLPPGVTRADLSAIDGTIDALQQRLPALGHAADVAAQRFAQRPHLAVRGSHAIAIELGTKPGGLASYHGSQNTPDPGSVFLYHLDAPVRRDADANAVLLEHLRDAIKLRQSGHVVIGFVDRNTIESLGGNNALAHACDAVVDVAGPGPRPLNHLVAAWAFQAELFAACTRLGRTPVLRKSPRLDRKGWRAQRYAGLTFHSVDTAEPIAAGVLGRRYLDKLRELLHTMVNVNHDALPEARQRIRAANQTGGHALLTAAVSNLNGHAAGVSADDPGALEWLDLSATPHPGPRDVIVAFGTDHAPGEPWWPLGQIQAMNTAGLGTVYVLDACFMDPQRDVPEGDVLIQTWQPWGDALVKIDGHAARVGASSGVLTEAIYHLLVDGQAAR